MPYKLSASLHAHSSDVRGLYNLIQTPLNWIWLALGSGSRLSHRYAGAVCIARQDRRSMDTALPLCFLCAGIYFHGRDEVCERRDLHPPIITKLER